MGDKSKQIFSNFADIDGFLMLLLLFLQIFCGYGLEIPAPRDQDSTLLKRTHTVVSLADSCRRERNYSLLYDPSTYTSYWVAYPLCRAHLSAGRKDSWGYDPSLPDSLQTSVLKNYSTERFSTGNYRSNYYARGHQVPNADRNASPAMQEQTYYATNLTPQLQNGFNGHIWAKLEKNIRDCALAYDDTLYVVTGAGFERADSSGNRGWGRETVAYVTNRNDGKRIPVPNWYWKAVLKVRRDSLGVPVDARCVAFHLPHRDLKGRRFEEYVVSVDSLEALTGFDFFPALPDSLEWVSERAANWPGFRHFGEGVSLD